jgi:hypothetical protein
MGKIHVSHRIVTRDPDGKIVSDLAYDSFATGEPAYRLVAQALPDGHEVTFQHGARVIFTAKGWLSSGPTTGKSVHGI